MARRQHDLPGVAACRWHDGVSAWCQAGTNDIASPCVDELRAHQRLGQADGLWEDIGWLSLDDIILGLRNEHDI